MHAADHPFRRLQIDPFCNNAAGGLEDVRSVQNGGSVRGCQLRSITPCGQSFEAASVAASRLVANDLGSAISS